MRKELLPRFVSMCAMALLFTFLPYVVKRTEVVFLEAKQARMEQEIAKQKDFYETVDIVEFLQASLVVSMVNDDVFQVTFTRTAPFYIPATQEQILQVFCNGFAYQLKSREPFPINMDEGYANVALSYHLSQWDREKAPDDIQGCTLNVTRKYVLELPYNTIRTMELKGTYVIE